MAGREAVDGQGEKEIAGRRSEIAPAALLHPSSSHAHTTHNTTQRLESVWFLTRVMQRPLGRSQGSSKDRSSLLKKCTGRAVKLYPGPSNFDSLHLTPRWSSTSLSSHPSSRKRNDHLPEISPPRECDTFPGQIRTAAKPRADFLLLRTQESSARRLRQLGTRHSSRCCTRFSHGVRASRVQGGSDSLEPIVALVSHSTRQKKKSRRISARRSRIRQRLPR